MCISLGDKVRALSMGIYELHFSQLVKLKVFKSALCLTKLSILTLSSVISLSKKKLDSIFLFEAYIFTAKCKRAVFIIGTEYEDRDTVIKNNNNINNRISMSSSSYILKVLNRSLYNRNNKILYFGNSCAPISHHIVII